ncbi:MAG: hypothetical protein ACE5EX_00385 [Phycisphaerae bacterium]
MAGKLKLPFIGRIFWRVLTVVALLLVAGWFLIPRLIDYTITPADYGGSSISALIFAYLIHLWLFPVDDHGR